MTNQPENQTFNEPNWGALRDRAAAVADPLTVIREDQAARWAKGEKLTVETYFSQLHHLTDEDLLVLIMGEIVLRRQAGESPTADEYQARFPRLADDIAVQFELLSLQNGSTKDSLDPSGRTREVMVLPRAFGRYRLLSEIGRGGMGTVYLAHDSELDRRVALKVPSFGRSQDPRAVERFRREAQAAAALNHPNLCPVFDIGRFDGVDYFTMPYLDGESLAARIARAAPLPVEDAVRLVRQIAVGLEAAHQVGVVHRDLKPSNILMSAAGEPVVTDFGLARRIGANDPALTDEGAVIGTAAYIPPEQIGCNPDEMGPRCDVYSLGIILYELLTGQVPFVGTLAAVLQKVLAEEPKPPTAVRPDLDPRISAVCLKAIAKDSTRRFASMGEFVQAVDESVGPPVEPRRTRFARRLLGGLVLVIAAGVGIAVWQVVGRERPHVDGVVDSTPPGEDVANTAAHPLRPGTEWTGPYTFNSRPPVSGTASLKVTDQQGATFRGVYSTEEGKYAWEVSGTAKNGFVQWDLVKALNENAQGTGAAGFATIRGEYTDRTLTLVYNDKLSEAKMTLTRKE